MHLQQPDQPPGLQQRGGHAPPGRRVGGAHRVPGVDQPGQRDPPGVVQLAPVGVVQPPARQDRGERPRLARIGPGRQGRDRPRGGLERGPGPQRRQRPVGAGPGDQGGDDPVVVDEHGRQVAGIGHYHPERHVDRPGRGAGPHLVLPGDVGDPAVTALSWSPQRPGQPPGPAARVDDQIGVDQAAGCPDPGDASPLAAHLIDMPGAQPHPGLGLGGFPQHPLEGETPAAQPGRHARLARQHGRHGPGRQQAVPDLGHLSQQRIDHLLTEKVRMVELHHALAVPLPAAVRPGITVDHRDLVPAPRQRDRGVQPGRPRPDDN